MKRLICLPTIAASVLLAAAVATAAGSTRPYEPGEEPTPTVVVVPSPSVRVDGFDWTDAGIGAASALGLGLLLAGVNAFRLSHSGIERREE
jgi:hypothetical protein